MSLTIELTRSEEARLRELAAENGRTAEDVAQEAVRGHLSARLIPAREQALLSKLARGLAPELWRRYHELNRKLRDECIAEPELQEFLKLNQQVEAWNAERMGLAAEIAEIRGIPFNEALKQLGMLREPEF